MQLLGILGLAFSLWAIVRCLRAEGFDDLSTLLTFVVLAIGSAVLAFGDVQVSDY